MPKSRQPRRPTALGIVRSGVRYRASRPTARDCLGVRGIARDLVAAGLGTLKADPVQPIEGAEANPVAIELRFADGTADACPAFAGRMVTGISNGPSPAWLQQRLKAIGLRPINALVDITNYITYDRGRPLHVFDADKLQGGIHARLGEKGESVPALDGNTYEVDGEMCVIADDSGVLGLGGIIGGEATGCTEATQNVFIESAYFDPIRTAKTGRRLNIISDARYRFERGVDPAYMVPGLEQATRMVLDLCGGTPSEVTVAGAVPDAERIIDFDISEVKRLTGVELAEAEIKTILTDLGFWLSGSGPVYKVAVPTWRPDAGQAADLVEEVVRIVGVDRVPLAPMTRANGVARPVLTEGQKRVRQTKRILAGRGLVEAVTWSFIPREQAELFGGGSDALELVNPMSSELSTMRPSLLASLLTAAQRNLDRGIPDGALFEVGQAYGGDRPEDQFVAASGVRLGTSHLAGSGRHWSGPVPNVDLFEAKADALAVLAALGFDQAKVQVAREAPDWFHPGKSGAFKLGPKTVLGHFGELHPRALASLGVDGPAAGFELFLEAVPAQKRKSYTRPGARRGRPAARAPRLRLRARCGRAGGRRGARRARRREGPDRRRRRLRRLRGREPRRRQEIARHRGHAAAPRQDADGRGDRRRLRQGRGRCGQGNRRGAAGVDRN